MKINKGEKGCSYLQGVVDAMSEPIVVINKDFRIELMNRAAKALLGLAEEVPHLCYEATHGGGMPCPEEHCPLVRICRTKEPMSVVHEHETKEGEKRIYEIFASPFFEEDGTFAGIIEYLHDITTPVIIPPDVALTLAEKSPLPGLIASCAWCKRVRDERGNWVELDLYIEARTGTRFTHSICPQCLKRAWVEV
jgi:hypothetical protein